MRHGGFPRGFDPPDEAPLILSEEDQKILNGLTAQNLVVQHRVVEFQRECARKQGVIAQRLEDLKSKSGQPFKEEARTSFGFRHKDYRRAVVKKKILKGLLAGKSLTIESAYLCRSPYLALTSKSRKKDPDSCGWVKGNPVSKDYDNIGFLSGSAGIRYYCKICGKLIGEEQHVIS